jgi:hypothetical protein
MYVLHGLAGIGRIALVMVHVYFAIRPEKTGHHKVDGCRHDESGVLPEAPRPAAMGGGATAIGLKLG